MFSVAVFNTFTVLSRKLNQKNARTQRAQTLTHSHRQNGQENETGNYIKTRKEEKVKFQYTFTTTIIMPLVHRYNYHFTVNVRSIVYYCYTYTYVYCCVNSMLIRLLIAYSHSHARTHRKKWIKESEGELKLGNQRKERKKKNWIRAITELFSVFCKIVSGSLKTKLEQLLCRRNERTNEQIHWHSIHLLAVYSRRLWSSSFYFHSQVVVFHFLWTDHTNTHTHTHPFIERMAFFYPNLIENVCECFFFV